jgi:putative ABC transport system permease protein
MCSRSPIRIAPAQIAAKIDAMLANSPSENEDEHREGVRGGLGKQVGDIGKILMWIVAMAMFTILLVAGNTMAQAIRERRTSSRC